MAALHSVPKEAPKDLSTNLKYQRDKDRQPVRGKFIFHEVPGGQLEFPFRKYKGDQIEIYRMTDGEILTVPLGVYKHLNQNGWYPIHQYTSDEQGRSTFKVNQKVRRFSFQSLEFLDLDDEKVKSDAYKLDTPVTL